MSDDKTKSLLSFMKKQASEKSSKNAAKKSAPVVNVTIAGSFGIGGGEVKENKSNIAEGVEKDAKASEHKDKAKEVKEDKKEAQAKEQEAPEEEMTEEERLEDAKKASRNKAAQHDQTEMIKKLLIQNIVKYTLLIFCLVIFVIGVINLLPAIGKFFDGFVYRMVVGAAKG